MVDCPKCSTKLDADFGMVTCPTCNSVVFVEFDGSAKIGNDPIEQASELNFQPEEELPPEPDLSAFDDAIADSMFAPIPIEAQGIESPGELLQTPKARQETFQSEPELEEEKSDPNEIVSPNDPLGVTAYANSEFSRGKDGPFVFNLFIGGLDSKEIRESLREAMNDSRFSWDANTLLGQIRGGKLQLKNVSPVQASILVNRLKRLPLSISWEQHAITTVEKF